MTILSLCKIITPENYSFLRSVSMNKSVHQIREEYWSKIMNECKNSGMSKTAWCRANGISDKQFFCFGGASFTDWRDPEYRK